MQTGHHLIQLLADGETHSGPELARRLGISRSAIWKRLHLLSRKGLDIQSIPGKGYRLEHPLEPLSEACISSALPSGSPARQADYLILDEVASTNQHLLNRGARPGTPPCICLAETQTAGRGRQGRHWHSPYGQNIYLSLGQYIPSGPETLTGLGLAAATAVMAALETTGLATGPQGAGLKWPNDILYQDRKLAGLLIEVRGESHGHCHLVIGVGVNLAMSPESRHHIDQPWTDLQTILGHRPPRNQLAATLIHHLTFLLERFMQNGLRRFIPDWQRHDLTHNKRVYIETASQRIEGIAQGIDDQGALIVHSGTHIHHIHAGDVHLQQVDVT